MIGFAGVPLAGVIRREGLWTGLSFEGGGKARACARERHAFEGRVCRDDIELGGDRFRHSRAEGLHEGLASGGGRMID